MTHLSPKKHILILSLVFLPDGVSTASLVAEIADGLAHNGFDVRVITTVPHYNFDADARRSQPLTKRFFYYKSQYKNVEVWHVPIGQKDANSQSRIRSHLFYNLYSLLVGLFVTGRADHILVVSPPLTSGVIAFFLKMIKRAKSIYNVQELYPDAYIEIGTITAQSRIASLLRLVERFVYHRSDALTVISSYFQETVAQRANDPSKVHLIPNFVDVKSVIPGRKANSFASEFNLTDKFVILYAGNIGLTQSFDTLIEVASHFKNQSDIVFLIVGDGARRNAIEKAIAASALKNIQLLAYQPRSRVNDMYASADVCLVPLMSGSAKTTLPSKLYTIMACGRAVLAAVDLDSDITAQVRDANCGLAIPPDNPQAMIEAIQQMHASPSDVITYGENGRRYVEQHYSKEAILSLYSRLFEDLSSE